MAEVPPKAQGFDPINFPGGVFDYPGIMVDNLVRGKMGEFNPAYMSLEDRQSLADRFKGIAGDNPISNALTDIAMNPWVWAALPMIFVFKNVPATHVLNHGMQNSALMRKHGPFLANMSLGKKVNFLTTNEDMSSFYGPQILQMKSDAFEHIAERWGNKFAQAHTKLLQNVSEATGVPLRSLQTTNVAMDGGTDVAATLNTLIAARLNGLDKAEDFRSATVKLNVRYDGSEVALHELNQNLATGKWKKELAEVSVLTGDDALAGATKKTRSKYRKPGEKLLDEAKVQSFLHRYGADELINVVEEINDEMFVTLYGRDDLLDAAGAIKSEFKDASGRLRHDLDILDNDKVARHARSDLMVNREATDKVRKRNVNNLVHSWADKQVPQTQAKVNQVVGSHEIMDTLFTTEIMDLLRTGILPVEEYQRALRSSLTRQIHYAPRNNPRVYIQNRLRPSQVIQAVDDDAYQMMTASSDAMSPLSASFERSTPAHKVLWDDADLKNLAPFVEDSREAETLFKGMVTSSQEAKSTVLQDIARPDQNIPVSVVQGLGFEQSYRRHLDKGARAYARNVAEVPDELIAAIDRDNATVRRLAYEKPRNTIFEDMTTEEIDKFFATRAAADLFDPGWNGVRGSMYAPMTERKLTPMGGYSYGDMMKMTYTLMQDPSTKDTYKRLLVPLSEGKRTVQNGILTKTFLNAQSAARRIVESPMGEAMKTSHPIFRKMHKSMSQFANDMSWIEDPMRADRGFAKFLYSSTLGINMMSVMLNMFQPLMTTSRFVEAQDLVAGYRDAFNALGKYAVLRTQQFAGAKGVRQKLLLGAHNKPEKARLWHAAIAKADDPFDVAKAAGIGEEALEILDTTARIEASELRIGPLAIMGDIGELFLKMFEKGEVVNRLATTRALMNKAAREGSLYKEPVRIARKARELTEMTQFGATLWNTPMVFLDKSTGNNALEILTQPLLRQFLTFPLRMTTMLLHGSPKMATMRNGKIIYPEFNLHGLNAATRVVSGKGDAQDAETAMAFIAGTRDWFKAMGIGAVTYAVGKEVFNTDLGGATVLGGSYVGAMRPEGPLGFIPASPAVSLALSPAVWAFTGKDYKEAFRNSIPTMVPGGVSLSRALGIAPDLPLGPFSPAQRTHVDWSRKTSDGRYPIFSNDGRLISYESKLSLAGRAAGVDFSSYRDETEFLRYMRNIREETVDKRADLIRSIVTGDLPGANQIATAYQEKYGHQLMVNENQINRFVDNQNRTRIERSLEGMPANLKQAFTGTAAETFGRRLGMSPQDFATAVTAKSRDLHRTGTISLTPEVRQQIQRYMESMSQGLRESGVEPARRRPDPMTPFGTYDSY